MNTPPPEETMSRPGSFAKIKEDLILGNEAAIINSWERLLEQLRKEVKSITEANSSIIPTIEFKDIRYTPTLLHIPVLIAGDQESTVVYSPSQCFSRASSILT